MKNQKAKTSGKNSPAINIKNAMAPVNVNLSFDNSSPVTNIKPKPFIVKTIKTKLKLSHLFILGLAAFPATGISFWWILSNYRAIMDFFYDHQYLQPCIYIIELSFLPMALALPLSVHIWRFGRSILTSFSFAALDENKNVYFHIEI